MEGLLSFSISQCIYLQIARSLYFVRTRYVSANLLCVFSNRLQIFKSPQSGQPLRYSLPEVRICTCTILGVRRRFPSGIHSFSLNSPAIQLQALQFPHLIPISKLQTVNTNTNFSTTTASLEELAISGGFSSVGVILDYLRRM